MSFTATMLAHRNDEALDTLNGYHFIDCAAVEGGDCNCEELAA